jgi:hypothetical protein
MMDLKLMPVLSALKHMNTLIEELTERVQAMQQRLDEWEVQSSEVESSDEWETETDSDDTASVQSAPATFSYKRQRT